ncbi:MAG: hypothetical protein ABL921_02190, partial [Pirellula sp.]
RRRSDFGPVISRTVELLAVGQTKGTSLWPLTRFGLASRNTELTKVGAIWSKTQSAVTRFTSDSGFLLGMCSTNKPLVYNIKRTTSLAAFVAALVGRSNY